MRQYLALVLCLVVGLVLGAFAAYEYTWSLASSQYGASAQNRAGIMRSSMMLERQLDVLKQLRGSKVQAAIAALETQLDETIVESSAWKPLRRGGHTWQTQQHALHLVKTYRQRYPSKSTMSIDVRRVLQAVE